MSEEQANPMYVRFSDKPVHETREFEPDVLLADYDADGKLVGVEILASGTIEGRRYERMYHRMICDAARVVKAANEEAERSKSILERLFGLRTNTEI